MEKKALIEQLTLILNAPEIGMSNGDNINQQDVIKYEFAMLELKMALEKLQKGTAV